VSECITKVIVGNNRSLARERINLKNHNRV